MPPFRELTAPLLRQAVDRLSDPVRIVARYHFGWCDAAGRPTEPGPGTGLHGSLVLGSAQALGAAPEDAIRSAVAVELVHHSTVLNDELMDRDHLQHGRPAAWKVFGDARAVLAGDALLTSAMSGLTHGPDACPNAAREMCRTLLALAARQDAKLAFESCPDVTVDECLAMAAGKAGSLFAGACALGGLAAGATSFQVDCLRRFGNHLGLAFQLFRYAAGGCHWATQEATRQQTKALTHLTNANPRTVDPLFCLATQIGHRPYLTSA
ncbi:polyprenyl synthetase family protein [Kribbella solani]|uniref:Geranylgeranyl pyrophosphate synthase n=1 Tax=Kribbella solani TaxID=236067 RepID=A0A841DSH1_9ACTN|nr:polyprenyl synthetase family protein [Kribbella solani]MBB5980871.1 geranylgeranyl pyrophosphate synthase [Kribbella solani]